MGSTAERPSQESVRLRLPVADPRPALDEPLLAGVLRALLIDPDAPAQLPLGMAEAATALWTRFLKYDAADPRWPDRDRFVMAADRSALLLQSLLFLTGHAGVGTEELARLRGADPATPLTHDSHPAVEVTSGAGGQGLATGVGLALAERLMAARFGKSLVDHRCWVVCSRHDLMEGISHEAASLAGHLRLEKLTLLLDDGIGPPAMPCSDDVLKRFSAYGWAVRQIDAHDPQAVAAAMSVATRARKPTLIACRTAAMAGLASVAPVGLIPESAADRWERAGTRGAAARRAWLKRLARHPMRQEFERAIAGRLPDAYHEATAGVKAAAAEAAGPASTLDAAGRVLQALLPAVPDLLGGAGGAESPASAACVSAGSYAGRHVHFGIRHQAMGAVMNGLALHRGLIPFAATPAGSIDPMRPALRLAADMRLRVVHVLTPRGDGDGADLAGLRAMSGVQVFRPADAVETAECWDLAMRRADGPSLLALAAETLPALRGDVAENRCARGAYLLAATGGSRAATLIASGPEVALAMAARAALANDGIAAAVVSMPCWELFARQDEAYRAAVLGQAPRFAIEAADGFGWDVWLGPDGTFLNTGATFGAGRARSLETIVAAVRRRLG
jgi:transketolase